MSSEQVWKKTHTLGGTLFKIAGIVTMVGVVFGKYSLWFVLVPILVVSISLVIYSYLAFRKEKS
jgi:uncharacterized membrane protein